MVTHPDTHTIVVQQHYGKLAPDYEQRWAAYLENTQKETLRFVRLKSGQSLLDIGCGTGLLLETLAKKFPRNQLTGIELSPAMMRIAQQRLRHLPVTPLFCDAIRLPFSDRQLVVVTCASVLHYLKDPGAALTEIWRVLKPHGHLILLDWNRDTSLFKVLEHFYFRQFFKAHVKTYSLREAQSLLTAGGFAPIMEKRWQHGFWSLMLIKAEKT